MPKQRKHVLDFFLEIPPGNLLEICSVKFVDPLDKPLLSVDASMCLSVCRQL